MFDLISVENPLNGQQSLKHCFFVTQKQKTSDILAISLDIFRCHEVTGKKLYIFNRRAFVKVEFKPSRTRSKTWYILSFAEPMAQWSSSTVTDGDRLAKTSGC